MQQEQRCFTADWKIRPDGPHHDLTNKTLEQVRVREKRMNDPGYKFLSTHNVWCLGKLMYDLMTLAWPHVLDAHMDNLTTEERYYGEYNEHAIPEIKTNKLPEYSSLLRDLIRECLHIKIGKRPNPEELVERTRRGLEAMVRSRQEEIRDPNGPRLYYMGNEINHMPTGGAGLPMRRDDWAAFRAGHFPNPLWQPLLSGRWADEVRTGELVNQPIEEGGPKRKRRPVHGNVKADARPLDFMNDQRGVIWKLRSSSLDREEDGANEGNEENEENMGNRMQKSGPHNAQELNPKPSKNDAVKARDAAEEAPTELQLATDFLADLAQDMAHPRLPPLEEPPLIIVNPPTEPSNGQPRPASNQQPPSPSNQPPPPSNQQALPSRKRRRVMGISIDENFQEAEGRVVRGHNLRKWRG
jgi:hypothetical protein